MLTRAQSELLNFIKNFQHENQGVSPSFEEMKQELGLHSKSGVHRLITALEERGFIRRLRNYARAIEVLQEPRCPTGLRQYSSHMLIAELARRGELNRG